MKNIKIVFKFYFFKLTWGNIYKKRFYTTKILLLKEKMNPLFKNIILNNGAAKTKRLYR